MKHMAACADNRKMILDTNATQIQIQIHRLDENYDMFARQGVDNSKMILETILGKIKLYEKGQDKKWAELIQVKIHSKLK